MRSVVVAVALACGGCVTIPERVEALPHDRALTFVDVKDKWTFTGMAGSVAYSDDGLTLTDGPGALVLALDATDYRVHVEANVEDGGNSGVFVRSKGGIWFPDGVEVQIDPKDPNNPTGSLYGKKKSRAPVPAFGTWFAIDVEVKGSRVTSTIDGIEAAVLDDAPPNGPLFGLQAHYPGSVVHFRNLRIEPIH